MSILNDGAKTLVPVATPLIGLGSASVKLGDMDLYRTIMWSNMCG